jgi:hypothetical protein
MRQLYRVILIVLGLILFSQTNVFSAKKKDKLEMLIEKLNTDLGIYSNLNVFDYDSQYSVLEYKLTKEELSTAYYGEDSLVVDSVGVDVMISIYQYRIVNLLNELSKCKNYCKVDFSNQLHEEMSFVQSEDKKLRNFSIDEKTGGSYRSSVSFTTYQTSSKLVPVIYCNRFGEQSGSGVEYGFNEEGFDEVHNISTSNGVKYIVISSVRYCSLCFEQSFSLVQYDGNDFINYFQLYTESRFWEGGIEYNKTDNSIEIKYVTDDLTPDCSCVGSDYEDDLEGNQIEEFDADSDEETDDESILVTKECGCSYRFDGTTFVLTSKSEKIIED